MDISKYISDNNGYDYLEIIMMMDENTYDIPEEQFNTMLSRLKKDNKSNFKYFQCDTKEYYNRNMVLIKKNKDGDIIETKAYQIKTIDVNNIDVPGGNKVCVLKQERKKVSTIIFPSSKTYDNIVYKRKLIFRVNNKIYLNFQMEHLPEYPGVTRRKVYINFNNSKDTDIKDVIDIINNILCDLITQ